MLGLQSDADARQHAVAGSEKVIELDTSKRLHFVDATSFFFAARAQKTQPTPHALVAVMFLQGTGNSHKQKSVSY